MAMDRNCKKSKVSTYFHKVSADSAKCCKCSSILKCKGGSTSTLGNHFKLKHKIVLRKLEDNNKEVPAVSDEKIKLPNTLNNFLKRESLGELLAKCAAHDGLSIRGIANSTAIKEFIANRNYLMPRSESTIKDLIVNFCVEKKLELRNHFSKLKDVGERFSITTNEWTNIRAKRFLCLTVHTNKQHYCLGLVNIEGTCDAIIMEFLIREKLLEFNLILKKDVVASTHDGASVMQKYGRLTGIESQLCFNHAIHLAVMDVFYTKTINDHSIYENNEPEDNEEDESDCDTNEDDINNNFDIVQTSDDFGNNKHFLQDNLNDVLKRSRKIVKHFKKSAVKNSILQHNVISQEGKEISLLLDCKTRWNSLIPMLERLLKLKNCIKIVLEETGREDLYNVNDFKSLQTIIEVLAPVELAVKKLSKENATLLTADGVFKFIFGKLREVNNDLSLKMYDALKKRFLERRNKTLVSLHKYIQTGSLSAKSNQIDELPYATKGNTLTFGKEVMSRLFMEKEIICSNLEQFSTETEDLIFQPPATPSQCLVVEMQKTISLLSKEYNPELEVDCLKEFRLFEATGTRTNNLKHLLDALNTIQPTSTSSERIFSVAGNLCTKIRSSMKHGTLDALVFLKCYFLKK